MDWHGYLCNKFRTYTFKFEYLGAFQYLYSGYFHEHKRIPAILHMAKFAHDYKLKIQLKIELSFIRFLVGQHKRGKYNWLWRFLNFEYFK